MLLKNKKILLLCFIIFLTLTTVAVIIGFNGSVNRIQKSKSSSKPTKSCVDCANNLKNNINTSVDPCENFYDFACGRKVEKIHIASEKTEDGLQQNHKEYVNRILHTYLNQPEDPTELQIFKSIKQFYKDCTNLPEIEEKGEESLLSVFAEAGGFPVLDADWNEDDYSWENMTFKFGDLGLNTNYLIKVSLSPHQDNSSIQQVDLDRPGFPDPLSEREKEYFGRGWDGEIVKEYKTYLKDLVKLLGATEEAAEEQMHDVVDFQNKLAKNFLGHEQRLDESLDENDINQHTLSEVQQMYDWLDWKTYLNTLMAPYIQLDDDYELYIFEKLYFDGLGELLDSTPKRVLANFFFVEAFLDANNYIAEKYRNRMELFVRSVTGQKSSEGRETLCTKLVWNKNKAIVAAFMAQKNPEFREIVEKNKPIVEEIIQNLKESLKANVRSAEWIDLATKTEAIQKIKALKVTIGYPDEVMNNTFLNEYFQNLTIVPGDVYRSSLSITKFDNIKEYEKFLNPPITEWSTFDVLAVDLLYSYQENKIEVSIAILIEQYTNPNRPHFINYGALGSFLSITMMFAFDPIGRKYDSKGTFREWWTPEAEEKYQEKISCLVNQYSSTKDNQTNLQLRGNQTIEISFIDNSGTKVAYDAYKRYVNEHGVEKRLKGLKNYSPEQIFWISMAQFWCSKSVDQTQKNNIATAIHPPHQYRVLFPVKNNVNFPRDFNCKRGTQMNPEKKCLFW